MTRQRRKFSKKKKLEAVRQIEDGEKTLSEVSRDLEVAPSTVSDWRKHGAKALPGKGSTSNIDDKNKEIARLRRELA